MPHPPPAPLDADAQRGLEAILFLADEPVDVAALAEALDAEPEDVLTALQHLAARYRQEERGLEIRSAAGGWRMYTAPATRPVVERWALAGRTGRLTQAALETLAVIAYKQPISRHTIGDIRGVNADAAVRSLVARGLVVEVGRDPGPGQAILYGTTSLLLEQLGLDSLDELPPLTDFLPDAPAPDEPDLGALKEIRRRLAKGGELAAAGPDRRGGAPVTADGGEPFADEDADALPAPAGTVGRRAGIEGMDDLTDRLEAAARNAVDRLRAAVGDAGADDPAEDLDGPDDDAGDAADAPDPDARAVGAGTEVADADDEAEGEDDRG